MWEQMREVFDGVGNDRNIRAVVLGSALSRIWTAGIDRKKPLLDKFSRFSTVQLVSEFSSDPDERNSSDPARKSIKTRKHILVSHVSLLARV